MTFPVLQVRGESQVWEVIRDVWEKRSVNRKNQVEILPHAFKSKSFPISISFHFCISSHPSPPSWPLPSLWPHGPKHWVVWLPLLLSHFWKDDSCRKMGVRTATKSLESCGTCSFPKILAGDPERCPRSGGGGRCTPQSS